MSVVNNDPLNPILSLEGFDLSTCPPPSASKRKDNKHATGSTDLSFTATDILSPAECKYIIDTATPLMASMENLYTKNVRSAKRAMISSPKVAGQIYRRITPHLQRTDYLDRTPMCFGQDGVWVPFGLNDCLKVFKYDDSDAFAPHRDGPWLPQPDRGSMFTVIIYLNDKYVEGETILRGSDTYDYIRVEPATGTALVFNHEQLHAGEVVKKGTKWILRTELIFMRIHSFYVDRDAFAASKDYLAMKALYKESQQAAVDGDRDAFFTKYQEVVRLQREAMMNDQRARKPRLLTRLGLEEFSQILSFLPHASVNRLLRVNRRTFMAVVQAPYWQDLFEGRVRQPIPVLQLTCASGALNATLPVTAEPSARDYFTLVRQRLRMLRHFTPVGLFCLDAGFALVGTFPTTGVPPGGTVGRTFKQAMDEVRKYETANVDPGVRSRTFAKLGGLNCIYTKKRYRPEYISNHYSVPFFYTDDVNQERLYDNDKMPKADPFRQLLSDFTRSSTHACIQCVNCAVVVVPPVDWWVPPTSPEHIEDKLNELTLGLLDELRVPAVAMIHPAVCAALGVLRLSPSAVREKVARLHFILEDSEARFLVDLGTLEAKLVPTLNHPIVLRERPADASTISLRSALAAGYLELTQNPTFPQQLYYRC